MKIQVKCAIALLALALFATVLPSCAPASTPEIIKEKEVVVTKEVPVTQVIEKEVVVTKEVPVTQVIEKEVVITPTPVGPHKGGIYIMGYPGPGQDATAGPIPQGSGIQVITWRLMYNALLEMDENWANFVPSLAEKWEMSPDGKEATFYLRRDVKWQDGQPFTAGDVVFTVKAWLSVTETWGVSDLIPMLKGGQEYWDGKSDELPGVTAVDEYTVKFTLAEPHPLFMLTLASNPIAPKHLFEGQIERGMSIHDVAKLDFYKNPVGTGPFRVVAYDADQYIEYVKNPDYFRGEPYLDKIVIRLFTSETPIVTGLETGEIDCAALWNKESFPRLAMLDHIRVWVDTAQAGWFRLNLNMDTTAKPDTPLADVRFRKAIAYAIPKQKICDTLLMGVSQPALNPVNAPSLLEGLELTDYSYNPDKAKELLAELGYDPETAPELTLSYITQDESPAIAAIQQALAEVGIKVKLMAIESAAQRTLYGEEREKWDLHWSYAGAQADWGRRFQMFVPSGWYAATWLGTPRYLEILELQNKEPDPAKRKALFQEAMLILDEELPTVALWTEPNTYFINTRVHGANNGAYKYGFPMNYIGAETWWLSPEE